MKNLKKVFPLILLILTINTFGQRSNIVSDDELFLTSQYGQPFRTSSYDVTVEDGYSKNYKYNFYANHNHLDVNDDGGAGGSIWLKADTIKGAGTVKATGQTITINTSSMAFILFIKNKKKLKHSLR